MEQKFLKFYSASSEKGANGLVLRLLRRGHCPDGATLLRWRWFRGEVKRVEMTVGFWEALAHTIQGRCGWRIMIKPPDWFEDLRKIVLNHRLRSANMAKHYIFPIPRMMRRNMHMIVSVGRLSRESCSEFPVVYYALEQQKVSRCFWGSRRVSCISSCILYRYPGEHLEKPWTLEQGRI